MSFKMSKLANVSKVIFCSRSSVSLLEKIPWRYRSLNKTLFCANWGALRNMSSSGTSSVVTDGADSEKKKRALIGVCQMTSKADKSENLKVIRELIQEASSQGAEMVFLPEACDYIAESRDQSIELSESLEGDFIQQCQEAAVKSRVWLSIGGFHQKGPTGTEKPKLLMTHVIIDSDGKVKGTYEKSHLFDLEIKDKVRLKESDYVLRGRKITPPIETPVGRVGMAICYDMRFPELALVLAQQGAQILTYPSAFTQPTGMAHWEAILRCRAIETQSYVIAAAQTGKHNAKRSSYGHALVVDPWGAVIAQRSEGTGVCLAEIDQDYLAKVRSEMPIWQHRRPDLYGKVASDDHELSTAKPDDFPSYQFGHVTVSSNQVFYRTSLSYAFVNIKPVLSGHTLVATLRPAARVTDLSPAEVTDLFLTVQRVEEVVKQHFKATSATLAIQDGPESGQSVEHVHAHILPRQLGDFEKNDEVFDHLHSHDKGWNENTTLRTEDEMAAEAAELRKYFYPSF